MGLIVGCYEAKEGGFRPGGEVAVHSINYAQKCHKHWPEIKLKRNYLPPLLSPLFHFNENSFNLGTCIVLIPAYHSKSRRTTSCFRSACSLCIQINMTYKHQYTDPPRLLHHIQSFFKVDLCTPWWHRMVRTWSALRRHRTTLWNHSAWPTGQWFVHERSIQDRQLLLKLENFDTMTCFPVLHVRELTEHGDHRKGKTRERRSRLLQGLAAAEKALQVPSVSTTTSLFVSANR